MKKNSNFSTCTYKFSAVWYDKYNRRKQNIMEDKMYTQEKYLAKKEYSQKLVLNKEDMLVTELELLKKKIFKLREGVLKAKVNSQAKTIYQQKLVEESEKALVIMEQLKQTRNYNQHLKAS